MKYFLSFSLVFASLCYGANYDPFELTYVPNTPTERAYLEHKGAPIVYIDNCLREWAWGVIKVARAQNKLVLVDYLGDHDGKHGKLVDVSDKVIEEQWTKFKIKNVQLVMSRHHLSIKLRQNRRWHTIPIHNAELFRQLKERFWQIQPSGGVSININAFLNTERQKECSVDRFMKN